MNQCEEGTQSQYQGRRIKAPIYNWYETIKYDHLRKRIEVIYNDICKKNPELIESDKENVNQISKQPSLSKGNKQGKTSKM